MKSITYILLLSIFALTSCKSVKTIVKEKEVVHTHLKDSTVLKQEVVLDTLVIEQQRTSDSISLQLLKQLGTFKHNKGKATSTIIYKDGLITSDCDCEKELKPYLREINTSFRSVLEQELNSIKTDIKSKEKNINPWVLWIIIIALALFNIIQLIISWKRS